MKQVVNFTFSLPDLIYMKIRSLGNRILNNYFLIGITFLVLYVVQAKSGFRFDFLVSLQSDANYKQISGYVFVLYFLYQWKLSRTKTLKQTKAFRRVLKRHKFYGMFLPVVLFLHSVELGTGYLGILTVVFLTTIFTGLINYENSWFHHKVYKYGWLITHITAAMLTLGLILFHVYVVYNYS